VVSTLLEARPSWCDDSDAGLSSGWCLVQAPTAPADMVGLADIAEQYWGASVHAPVDTVVIGKGQFETPPVCDYPTVARTRTRTRPGR
jgi:hypothetical protein